MIKIQTLEANKSSQFKHPSVSYHGKGELLAEKFRRTCRGEYKLDVRASSFLPISKPTCNFIHHSDSFLKLAPFCVEVVLFEPYRIIIHHIFTDFEMDWIKKYSSSSLSTMRNELLSAKNLKNLNHFNSFWQ